ncbi:MAG: hypothetical protein BVN28_12665, partial [Nitrospira sp. ST-bin4]
MYGRECIDSGTYSTITAGNRQLICKEERLMSTRQGKRYTMSYKERESPKQDPYAMLKAPKGPAICRKCLAIYADKRWHF